MNHILDLGCGCGRDLRDLKHWGVRDDDEITGIDIDAARIRIAETRFPDRNFFIGRGEKLPFPNNAFDRVLSNVALPYMNIPQALKEINRVLRPGGNFIFSLHPFRFTVSELIRDAFPKPLPMLFRLGVMANGLLFHVSGRPPLQMESFQTVRGMRLALRAAGFESPDVMRRGARFEMVTWKERI